MLSQKKISTVLTLIFVIYFTPMVGWGQQTNAVTVHGTVVNAKTGARLPGVNIIVVGTNHGTVTNGDGKYSLSLHNWEDAKIKFSFVGYQSITKSITSYPTDGEITLNVKLIPTVIIGNELVVTGSPTGKHSVLTSAEPVDVIQVEDLNIAAPQIDLNQLLTFIAPSFQSNRQSAADKSQFMAPASLRGMGPDQVLVLINGKRRHRSSIINLIGGKRGTVGTDLSVIPTAAIDRIEILRNGASTQYGSDAIAGVINIILKQDSGLQASITGGAYKAGDGETIKADINYGIEVSDGGYVNVTGSFLRHGATNRTGQHDLHVYTPGFAYPLDKNPEQERAKDNQIIQDHGYTREHFKFHIGDAAVQIASFFVNAAVPINDEGWELYAFGGLSKKTGTGYPFRRLPSSNSNVKAIYPDGFQPLEKASITDKALTVGIRGDINGWDIDFSNTYGGNTFNFRLTNTLNASMLASSPTSFDVGGTSLYQNVTNLDISKFFADILSGTSVAFGSEFRTQSYQIRAGEEASWRNYGITNKVSNGVVVGKVDTLGRPGGAQGFPGFRPSDEVKASRTNIGVYGAVKVNVTPQFLVDIGARFERYSDFGNTINGKISARYLFGDILTLRGTISTGFRAPSLQQVYYTKVTADFNANNRLVKVGTFSNNSRPADILGIPDLKQETATNYSFGFSLRPLNNLSISVNMYQIDVDDRIILTSNFSVTDVPDDIAQKLSSFGVQSVNFFTNAIDTRTRGLDVQVAYNHAFNNNSQLNVRLAANFNDVQIQGAVNTSPQLKNQADLYLRPWDRLRLEDGDPASKFSGSINYKIGRFSVYLRTVRFGSVRLNTGMSFGVVQEFSPKWVTDLTFSYQLYDNLLVTVGSKNLFDVYPDELKYPNSYYGVFKYPPAQMGFNGAYYFGRLTLQM